MTDAGTPMSRDVRWAGPFIVAHRAGNDLTRLRRAQTLGIPFVEADIHLFGGRLEVRHLKTLGPVPILWDRWSVAPPWAPRLLLDDLLGAVTADTELMLDLKGRHGRLPPLVAAAIAQHGAGRAITVCSQRWELLKPLQGVPGVRLVHSVGSARQLAMLRRRFAGWPLAGISIHRRLLDAATVRALRDQAELVMSWPVETPDQARTLGRWGVQGLITSRFDEPAFIYPGAPAGAAAA